jgi:hypothetical protein
MQPDIRLSTNKNQLYCLFTLAEKSGTAQHIVWHNVNLYENAIIKKTGLTDKESIKAYLLKIDKKDFFKFKGYHTSSQQTDKEEKEIIRTSFIVTEILAHNPYIPKK